MDPHPPLAWLLWAFLPLAGGMLLLWTRMLRTGDATSVDVAWATGIGLLGLLAALLGSGALLPRALAGGLALLWSGRLALHLLRDRVWSGRGEDGRYRALRTWLGHRWRSGFLVVYLVQALLVLPFALPFLLLARQPGTQLQPVQWTGLLLFAAGLVVNLIADRQLAAHRADPAQRGRTCRTGLWRWSRHPNYFGEWVLWCGLALLALPAPQGWLAVATPVLLFVLLHAVSGIPFVERQAVKSRGDDYRRYQRTTSRFFPWPPRAEARP